MENSRITKTGSRITNFSSSKIISMVSVHLPSLQMFFVLLPLTIYSIFTMGMSPVDPELRTGYYTLFLGLIPLGFSIGFLVGRILHTIKMEKFRLINPIMLLLDILIALSIITCIIWFEYKFSLWPWGDQGDYIGWDWQSHYQQNLLQILFALLSIRSGIGMSIQQDRIVDQMTDNMSAIILLSLLSVEYLIAYTSDSWIVLYYFIFAYNLVFAALKLLVGNQDISHNISYNTTNQVDPRIHSKTRIIQHILVQLPMFILLPIVFLTQNCFIGMMYITHYWGTDWLKLYALMLLSTGLVVNVFWFLPKRRYLTKINPKTQDLILILSMIMGTFLFLLNFQLLSNNLITPLHLTFFLLTSFGMGAIFSSTIRLLKKLRHSVSKYILLIFCLILGSVGYAGGIAYYYYEPLGLEYVSLILSWLTLIAFVICVVCLGIQMLLIKTRK